MAKNTSILLGEHFEELIDHQIQSGRFSSASEVIRAALRLFEREEDMRNAVVGELEKGERSGFVERFDRKKFIKKIHGKHSGQ